MTTYAIKNPYWLADTFIFRRHGYLGSIWVKINHKNKIEEIGCDFPSRFGYDNIKDIECDEHCKVATKLQQSILNRIGEEYFYKLKKINEVEKSFIYEEKHRTAMILASECIRNHGWFGRERDFNELWKFIEGTDDYETLFNGTNHNKKVKLLKAEENG